MPPDILTNQLEKDVQEIEEKREKFLRELGVCSWTPKFCDAMTRYLESLQSRANKAQEDFETYSSQDWQPRDKDLMSKIQKAIVLCDTYLPLLEQRKRQLSTSSPSQSKNLTGDPATS
jgi:hypothetical protein